MTNQQPSFPNGEYDYWSTPQSSVSQDPAYPMQPITTAKREESIFDAVRNLQQSLLLSQQQQQSSPSPLPYSSDQQQVALPGNGLTVVIETDVARLRITFESK